MTTTLYLLFDDDGRVRGIMVGDAVGLWWGCGRGVSPTGREAPTGNTLRCGMGRDYLVTDVTGMPKRGFLNII